jgi:hypothetical protein
MFAIAPKSKRCQAPTATNRTISSGVRAALRHDSSAFRLPSAIGNQAVLRLLRANSGGSDHLSGLLHNERELQPKGKCSCGGTCSKCEAQKRGGADAHLGDGHGALHASSLSERTANRQHPRSGFEYDLSQVTVQTIRPSAPSRLTAALSPAGQEPAAIGDDLVTAQPDAGVPAPKPAPPSSGSGSAGPAPPAPSCTYSITYANQHSVGCDGGRCGAGLVYDITRVTATGAGCPSTLNGLTVTEVVTNDHGCTPANVQGGAGCPIGAGGTVQDCTDTYSVCLGSTSQAKIPAAGCTETVTQKLFVGGVLAETHLIRFPLTKTGSTCTGTVNRS